MYGLNYFFKLNRMLALGAIIITTMASTAVQATIVQIETAFGNFEVNLYDQTTPKTVENFLAYVEQSDYNSSIIHRAVSGFIIQGGGFAYQDSWPASAIASNAAVENEPLLSNVRGTIAMAKLSGNANSATNQWYINLADNSQNLDFQNGGFTVFGEVIGDGMTIVDQIAALPKYNLGGAFTDLPLQAYDGTSNPDNNNLAIISNILVIDAATDTAANLSPPASAALNVTPPSSGNNSSSGGGSFGSVLLILLTLAGIKRRA